MAPDALFRRAGLTGIKVPGTWQPDNTAMKTVIRDGRRGLYFCGGFAAFSAGLIGAFLPLLPATPFLLLALFCFARSSRRWQIRVLRLPVLGPPLRQYLRHRSIPFKAKLVALGMLWPSVGWTATQVVPLPAVGAGLVAVAILVTVWLLSIPSVARA